LIDWLDALVEGTGNHCLGKPPFAAPEQRLKEGKIDSRTMVYALAVLLYFMITGEGQAVDVDGRPLYLSNNLEERFPGIGSLSPELKELIRECTEVDNKNRPTITELVLKLESLERARNSDQVFQV